MTTVFHFFARVPVGVCDRPESRPVRRRWNRNNKFFPRRNEVVNCAVGFLRRFPRRNDVVNWVVGVCARARFFVAESETPSMR